MIDEVDENKDGRLDYKEVLKMGLQTLVRVDHGCFFVIDKLEQCTHEQSR